MKYLFILFIGLVGCKKNTTPPIESCNIEAYCKSGNFTVNGEILKTVNTQNYSESFEVTNNEQVVYIKNNIKSNDSLFLMVRYKGITKKQGVKCLNSINTISFQLSTF